MPPVREPRNAWSHSARQHLLPPPGLEQYKVTAGDEFDGGAGKLCQDSRVSPDAALVCVPNAAEESSDLDETESETFTDECAGECFHHWRHRPKEHAGLF